MLAAVLCISLQGMAQYSVSIYPKERIAEVSPLFWGTNFLFWADDDAALSDGVIEKALADLPCRILRYPGGTVADNFLWDKNLLVNSAMFPYEEGEAESDFDEFMALCLRIGAEPMLVVNTQTFAINQDVEGGAAYAAEWVRYCKEKGYKVRYWEIGNETYWHPVMTAREYGRLVSVYSKAMKAVDPDIIVSANGPWDTDVTGDKERLDSKLWESTRLRYGKLETREQYEAFKESVKSVTVKPWNVGDDKWWHDVISECGDDIDMVSVHWYYHDNNIKHIDKKLLQLKAYFKEMKPAKDYLLCMSEYNCNTSEGPIRILGLAESLGRYLNAGTDISCFWPMRLGGTQSRSMLDYKTNDIQYPYQLFQMYQKEMTGRMVRCESPEGVYTFANSDGKGLFAVVSNRELSEESEVRLSPGLKLRKKSIEVKAWRPDEKCRHILFETIEYKLEKGVLTFKMAPETFITITIR